MTDQHLTNSATTTTCPRTTATVATEVVLPGVVEPDGLQVGSRRLPAPAAGQVIVAVEASGVSFAEQQMRLGTYYDQPPFPFVPGYDLVGTVTAVGADVDPQLVGARVAALTKIGGWASAVLLDAADLVPVPAGVDPAEAETLVVSGITAWQMLHRHAHIRRGQTVLVHGANGSVGTNLVQLARHAGARVIGTAAPRHHDAMRALGAEPIDYNDPDLPARVRELAPDGVDAVFDHLGGESIVDSWRLLAPGGTLVSYGSAATKGDTGSSKLPVLKLVARLLAWNLAPNGKHASFYNVWAGLRRRAHFHARLREDLGQVFALLADGTLTAQVAARLPLNQASAAMTLAESRTIVGKVVLIPTPA